jgi:hypothetical protein
MMRGLPAGGWGVRIGAGALVEGLASGCGLVAAGRGAVGGAFGDEAQPPARSAALSQRAAQAHRKRGSVVRARADIGAGV